MSRERKKCDPLPASDTPFTSPAVVSSWNYHQANEKALNKIPSFFKKKKELDKNQMSTYVSICLHIDND